MHSNLKSILGKIKEHIKKDSQSILYGDFNEGAPSINKDNTAINEYMDFLSECNGARFGSIEFWSFDELPSHQYRVEDLPGGKDNWLEIGQILYEPLVICKLDGKLYSFLQGFATDNMECFSNFDDFLTNYVFGKKYMDIIPDSHDEEWVQALVKLKLI